MEEIKRDPIPQTPEKVIKIKRRNRQIRIIKKQYAEGKISEKEVNKRLKKLGYLDVPTVRGTSSNGDKWSIGDWFILISVILVIVISFLVGLGFIIAPIYISGFLIAMTWQFLFNRNRSFKDKFYVSLYSWLFIL